MMLSWTLLFMALALTPLAILQLYGKHIHASSNFEFEFPDVLLLLAKLLPELEQVGALYGNPLPYLIQVKAVLFFIVFSYLYYLCHI